MKLKYFYINFRFIKKKKLFPSTCKSGNRTNLKSVELTDKIIKKFTNVSLFLVIRGSTQNSIKEFLIGMESFRSFVVIVARWCSKVFLQFLYRFLGRLSWAASQTLDNVVFSRLHLTVSVFVRIVIVVRGIRIQSPFRHRTLSTSFSPYTIFHRLLGFREFSLWIT